MTDPYAEWDNDDWMPYYHELIGKFEVIRNLVASGTMSQENAFKIREIKGK